MKKLLILLLISSSLINTQAPTPTDVVEREPSYYTDPSYLGVGLRSVKRDFPVTSEVEVRDPMLYHRYSRSDAKPVPFKSSSEKHYLPASSSYTLD